MLDSWLHDYNSLPCNCPKNVGPIRGSDSTFELPTRDGWNPNIAKASSFVQSLKAEELGKTIVFSAIIPPSPMCIYIYIYIHTVYDIYYKCSREVFSGLQTTLWRVFYRKKPTDSLHASSSQIAMRASLWRAVGQPSSSPELIWRDFSSSETPKPPHTIHTEPAPFSCRLETTGKWIKTHVSPPVFHPPGPQIPPPSWRALLALRPTHHNRNQRTTAAPSPRERGRVGFAWEKRLSFFFAEKVAFFKDVHTPTTSYNQPTKGIKKSPRQNFLHLKKKHLCSLLSHGKNHGWSTYPHVRYPHEK